MKSLVIAFLMCVVAGLAVIAVDLYRNLTATEYTLHQYETVYPALFRVEQATHDAQFSLMRQEISKLGTEHANLVLTVTDQAALISTMQPTPRPTITPTWDADFQPVHCASC